MPSGPLIHIRALAADAHIREESLGLAFRAFFGNCHLAQHAALTIFGVAVSPADSVLVDKFVFNDPFLLCLFGSRLVIMEGAGGWGGGGGLLVDMGEEGGGLFDGISFDGSAVPKFADDPLFGKHELKLLIRLFICRSFFFCGRQSLAC